MKKGKKGQVMKKEKKSGQEVMSHFVLRFVTLDEKLWQIQA